MNETLPVELSQAEREHEAHCKAMDLARLGDRVGHAKAWAEYARIKCERSPEVVRALEKARGLT